MPLKWLSMPFTFVCLAALWGCRNTDQQLIDAKKKQTAIETRAQIDAENQNWQERAREMEKDLAARHRFFQALKGEYEGQFKVTDTLYKVRIVLTPSLAPYQFESHRDVRREEEIVSDLNNLTLNANIHQWSASTPMVTVSCRINGIRPDIQKGEISMGIEGCPNAFFLRISRGIGTEESAENSRDLAARILDGVEDRVPAIVGSIHPGPNPSVYKFRAQKKVDDATRSRED